MRIKRKLSLGLLVPAVLALLPVLIGSSAPTTVQAGASATKSNAVATTQTRILVMQVYFRDRAERDRLAAEFSAEEVPTTGGFLTIIGDQDTLKTLQARGLRVEIDQHNTAVLNNPTVGETFYGGYKTVEEIYTFLDQKVAAYPLLAEKIDIGDSWCKTHPGSCTYPQPNNGYDLFVLHITNRNIPGPKPVFWFDAGIHAREIATPEVAMRYISYLLDNYNTDPDAHWLVDYHDIWIMPTFNPDGHHIVEAPGEGTPYMYRKNGNNSAGNCNIPPDAFNHFGVDNNRNFSFLWACCGGSSTDPCDQTYHGVSANSEDENQAVMTKIRELFPDQRGPNITDTAPITTTGVYQNMHTVASVNLYSWGWTTQHPPNYPEISNIGAHLGAVNAGGNGYQSCTIPECLYIVDGGSVDWTYGELGIASMSTELGGSGFLPDYSEIPGLYNENKGMLTYLAKIARTPYLTTRGPDANGVAAIPMTVTVGLPATITGTMNYDWTGNIYAQNVAAAEYYVDTPPWAGGTAIPMAATDGTFDEHTEGVTANIDTGILQVGRHIIFVRGRGVNNYEGFESWGPVSAAFLDITGGPPTPTPSPIPSSGTATATRTATTVPTATATPSSTPPSTATSTSTDTPVLPTATATSTACSISFTDVPPDNPFYTWIRCLVCRGVISGFGDGTFRPGSDVTRGQLSKILSNSAGFIDDPGPQIYEDVDPSNPFFQWVNRLSNRGFVGGYECGSLPEEPCVPPANMPYFRPFANTTRGQTSKFLSNTAGYDDEIPPDRQTFEDVPPGSPFWLWVERLVVHNVLGGYLCGGPGDPCVPPANRPYYHPGQNITRGQVAKVAANVFFPNCDTPTRK